MQFGIGLAVLSLTMVWYRWVRICCSPWLLALLMFTMLSVLSISPAGAAMNICERDLIKAILTLLLSMLICLSTLIYPLSHVRRALMQDQAAGECSKALYPIYRLRPMSGGTDGFQRALFKASQLETGR